ncbi:MAG: glycosyltransferase family 4 protein [Planctomycetota bacterium]
MANVLHVLAQRPGLTGSGVTLHALAAEIERAGWQQHVVCAAPVSEPVALIPGVAAERVHALGFGGPDLPFDVPGMSDVMPYPSTVFSAMSPLQWAAYERAWRTHLARALEASRPDVIHSHHVWFVSALLRELAPDVPLVVHCHATGLRQLARAAPALADRVRAGCRGADAFVVLHEGHVAELAAGLGVPRERAHIVGAGFSPERLQAHERGTEPGSILYVGKIAEAKGVGALLSAAELLAGRGVPFRLHVVGGGAGEEASRLRARMAELAPHVVAHGRMDDDALAARMRRTQVFTLPSFYEGLPLVLVEARAAGCHLVASDLPGVRALGASLSESLTTVSMPRVEVDVPHPDDLPAFTARLADALEAALMAPEKPPSAEELAPFTWPRVFARIEGVWGAARGSRRTARP